MNWYELLFYKYIKGAQGQSKLRIMTPVFKGGTEQILPENGSTPTTAPIIADIRYPDALRTDQTFLYRESPTQESGNARLRRIKGNTLAFNQLIENGNFASTSKWYTQQSATQSASNNVMTVTCETDNGHTVNIFSNVPAGHKCLISCECKTASANARAIMAYCGNYTDSSAQITLRSSSTNWERLTGIVTSAAGNVFQFRLYADSATNQFRNAMLIDLTQMFGQGNEPTVEQFKSYFPLSYYSYQSTLLPFKGTSIKTVGFNQWDEDWETGMINASTGQNENSTATFRAKNYIPVLPNTQYYLYQGENKGIQLLFYNGTTFLGESFNRNIQSSGVFTTPAEATAMRFRSFVAYGPTYLNDVCINISSSKNGTYGPYTSHTTNLPTLTYFPTGMKSAGSVYDELLPNKAITRVGMVDLGSLNYARTTTQTSGVYRFIGSGMPSDTKRPSANNVVANMSSIYQSVTMESVYFGTAPNMSISISAEGTIQLRNDSYTTPEALKSAMSNVYLFYELATPTETPITAEDSNEALSLLMGKSVSSNNAKQMIDIITKGE